MNKKALLFLTFFILIGTYAHLFAKDIPYTLEDRDRLIRIETTLKEFREYIDKRFEDINKRLDQLINIFIGIVAAFAGIVAVTVGFAIWDRRTALKPVLRETKTLEDRLERIEKALKEIAQTEQKVAEALKHTGLL
jgi:uncharacterized protein (UPF0210 family)